MTANASKSDPTIQTYAQTTSNVLNTLAAMAFSNVQVCKQKSLRYGPVEVIILSRIKWPYEYVYPAFKKKGSQTITCRSPNG